MVLIMRRPSHTNNRRYQRRKVYKTIANNLPAGRDFERLPTVEDLSVEEICCRARAIIATSFSPSTLIVNAAYRERLESSDARNLRRVSRLQPKQDTPINRNIQSKCNITLTVKDLTLQTNAIVVARLLQNVDIILGMDAIVQQGGVVNDSGGLQFVKSERHLQNRNAIHSVSSFNCVGCTNGIKEIVMNNGNIIYLADEDFEVKFDGQKGIAEWKWIDSPPNLLNTKSQYNSTEDPQAANKLREKIVKWIEQGIQVKCVEPVEK
ncbi:hypothetical protein GJ496_001523 [Pomphorhynchus laevis]|nr:hypothetical protein GJ496_001523 [Pomphorhynchus laevis]